MSTVYPSLRNQLTFETNDSLIKDVMIDDFPTPSAISVKYDSPTQSCDSPSPTTTIRTKSRLGIPMPSF
jgi:hypothetical protein